MLKTGSFGLQLCRDYGQFSCCCCNFSVAPWQYLGL